MRISDWSSDVCSSDLPNGSFADVASAGFVAQISGKLLRSDPLDRIAESLHRTMVAAVTRMTSGLSPTTLDKALTDWSHHFAFSPGKSPQLDGQAGGKYATLFEHLIRSAHQRDAAPARSEE